MNLFLYDILSGSDGGQRRQKTASHSPEAEIGPDQGFKIAFHGVPFQFFRSAGRENEPMTSFLIVDGN